MMRRFASLNAVPVAAVFLALGVATPASADDDVGCGLGTQIWHGQSGMMSKLFAATTNTSASQTLAIIFGTWGCERDGVITADARRAMFAGANLDQLAAEIATGRGEALDALESLLAVSSERSAPFRARLRADFDQIFASAEDTAGVVLERIAARAERL